MAIFTSSPRLSARFSQALQFAFQVHQKQIREIGEVPYIAHLMTVASLVLEANGNEDEAIAALLHASTEEVGVSIEAIKSEFGDTVADIVSSLLDDKELPELKRKLNYLERLQSTSDSVKLVSFADKLHNLRGYATDRNYLWKKSLEGRYKDSLACFYNALISTYEECDRIPEYFTNEYIGLLSRLERGFAEEELL